MTEILSEKGVIKLFVQHDKPTCFTVSVTGEDFNRQEDFNLTEKLPVNRRPVYRSRSGDYLFSLESGAWALGGLDGPEKCQSAILYI